MVQKLRRYQKINPQPFSCPPEGLLVLLCHGRAPRSSLTAAAWDTCLVDQSFAQMQPLRSAMSAAGS